MYSLLILQVYTNSSAATERDPVDIMVRQFGRMIAFQLPTVQRRGDTGHLVHSSQQRSIGDLSPDNHGESFYVCNINPP